MNQAEIIRTLYALHEHASVSDILDGLVALCMARAEQEEALGNDEGSAQYARAQYLIESLDFVYV